MVEQLFVSPQVKPSVIISNKYGIYELPHEFPNDVRPMIVGNYEMSGKSQSFIELLPSAQSSSQNKNFANTSKKLQRKRN